MNTYVYNIKDINIVRLIGVTIKKYVKRTAYLNLFFLFSSLPPAPSFNNRFKLSSPCVAPWGLWSFGKILFKPFPYESPGVINCGRLLNK